MSRSTLALAPAPPVVALALALLLLAPTAAAWPWSDPVTIRVGESRVGDLLQYTSSSVMTKDGETEERTSTTLIRVESRQTIPDKFGIDRDTVLLHVQSAAQNGTVEWAERCYSLVGGDESVRHDVLMGFGWGGQWGASSDIGGVTLYDMKTEYNSSVESGYYDWPCAGRNPLAGRTFTEGTRARLGEIADWWGDDAPDALSAPARATQFGGRDALAYDFDLRVLEPGADIEGTFTVTLADGLPSLVKSEGVGVLHDSEGDTRGRETFELTGIIRGEGAAIPPDSGAVLPKENPVARFIDHKPGDVPVDGFGFAYDPRDAQADLLADPTVGLKEWLAAHPDAILVGASHVPDGRSGTTGGVGETDGIWSFHYSDVSSGYFAYASRKHVDAPDALDALVKRAQPGDRYGGPIERALIQREPTSFPARVVDGASIAATAAALDMPKEAIRTYSLWTWVDDDGAARLTLNLQDSKPPTSDGVSEGRTLSVDPTTGAAREMQRTRHATETASLLDPLPARGAFPKEGASTLSVLAGPGVGAGLAGGAALTGLALLVIAVKFLLVPLFTRLRRDRLLDNPVRARLYERVRADPGIHQADLIDSAGIGEGATRHHLTQLAKHRLLVEARDDGFVRYYAAGEVPPTVARQAAVLRAATARAVYDLYAAQPDITLREAGARLGLSAPSVHRAKKKLEKAGLLPATRATIVEVSA